MIRFNEGLCLFLGHKYRLAQELSPRSRRVGCTRCARSFVMNDDCLVLVDWDADFYRLYESHGVTIKYQPWEFNKNLNRLY